MSQLEEIYTQTIQKLKNQQRPLIRIDRDLEVELTKKWKEALEKRDLVSVKKVLCLLDNSQNTSGAFEELFVQSLEQFRDPEMTILILGSSSNHMILHAQKEGRPIHDGYTKILLSLLKTQDPEVLEWVLRTIEQYGAQSIRFKNEILKAKPGLLAFTNQHKKNAKQIIELLERRWNEITQKLSR